MMVKASQSAFLFNLHLTIAFLLTGDKRATPHDVLSSYRPFIKNAKLVLNAGLTPEEAEPLIASGKIDIASFGRSFIANPDYAKKLERGIELNQIDFTTLQGPDHATLEEIKKGYIDYKLVADVEA